MPKIVNFASFVGRLWQSPFNTGLSSFNQPKNAIVDHIESHIFSVVVCSLIIEIPASATKMGLTLIVSRNFSKDESFSKMNTPVLCSVPTLRGRENPGFEAEAS